MGTLLLSHMRRATEADALEVQAVLESDPETFALLEGAPPRTDEAVQLLRELPPGVTPERKYVFVADGVAVVDLVQGYPDEATWYLGLIFVAPGLRGRGVGTALLRSIAAFAREHGGRALRLAVVTENVRARQLYERLGFRKVARRTRTAWNGVVQEVEVMELALEA